MEDAENAGAYASRDFHVSTLNFQRQRKKPDEERSFWFKQNEKQTIKETTTATKNKVMRYTN